MNSRNAKRLKENCASRSYLTVFANCARIARTMRSSVRVGVFSREIPKPQDSRRIPTGRVLELCVGNVREQSNTRALFRTNFKLRARTRTRGSELVDDEFIKSICARKVATTPRSWRGAANGLIKRSPKCREQSRAIARQAAFAHGHHKAGPGEIQAQVSSRDRYIDQVVN